MQYFHTYCITICFSLGILSSCTQCGRERKAPVPIPAGQIPPAVHVPEFSADSAYAYIEKQVSFGPRVPGTEAHRRCAAWLREMLASRADTVIVQTTGVKLYNGKVVNALNIIAEFNAAASNRILLCAHWDTRPFADRDTLDPGKPIDGANDGGSGVGILLEIARLLQQEKPSAGVDIVLFDVEDYGPPEDERTADGGEYWCLGSQYWARNPHRPGYRALYGILLDMAGAKDAVFTMEGTSVQYAEQVLQKVWETASRSGYSYHFRFDRTPPIIDDHLYVNRYARIPCIDIIQHDSSTPTRFGSYWHTHRDNMDVIERNTLKAVGQTVVRVVFEQEIRNN